MNQELLADAFYHAVVAALLDQQPEVAEKQYRAFSTYFPQHPKCTALAGMFQAKRQDQSVKKRIFVLAIGINQYAYFQKFQGCVNDARLFTDTIKKVWEHTADLKIQQIFDEQATYKNISEYIIHIEQDIEPDDTFVMYFSGMAGQMPGSNPDGTPSEPEYALLTTDTPQKKHKNPPCLRVSELKASLLKMQTQNKYLIIDSNMSSDFFGNEGGGNEYTVIFGCDEGEMAHEAVFSGQTHGIFTYALVNVVQEAVEKGDWNINLHSKIVQYIKDRNYNQTPRIAGDITPLFMTDMEIKPEEDRRIFWEPLAALTERDYYRLRAMEKNQSLTCWPVFKKMGAYLLSKKDIEGAANYLNLYADHYPTLDNTLAAVELFDQLGYYDRALEALDWYSAQPGIVKDELVQQLMDKYNHQGQIEVFDFANQYALLVGISGYKHLEPLKSAKTDAEYWKTILTEQLGFPAANITLLTDEEATRERILLEYDRHVQLSIGSPVLFYFAGYGSSYEMDKLVSATATKGIVSGGLNYSDKKYVPAILPYEAGDGQTFDILFSELSERYTGNHLVSIFDMGVDDIIGDRGLRAIDPAAEAAAGDTANAPRLANLMQYRVGNATILPGVVQTYDSPNKKEAWCVENKDGGVLTTCILDYILDHQGITIYLSELARAITAQKIDYTSEKDTGIDVLSPVFMGEPQAALFHPYRLGRREIDQLKKSPFAALQNQLQQLSAAISQDFPDYQVNLAITNALLGETESAWLALTKAAADELTEDRRLVKANYHLGRLLVETSDPTDKENWSQAVNALRNASRSQPDFAPAYYYLGKAIHQLSALEGRLEAAKAFTEYEKKGYPIGYREEVEEFLDSLDDSRLKKRRMEQGIQHLQNEDFAEAEKCFREALQLGDTDAWYYIGEIYEKKSDFLPALGSYKNALTFGVSKEDLPYRIAHMFRKVVTNVDFTAEVLAGLKAYTANDGILRNQAAEGLVSDIEKLAGVVKGSGLAWEEPKTR